MDIFPGVAFFVTGPNLSSALRNFRAPERWRGFRQCPPAIFYTINNDFWRCRKQVETQLFCCTGSSHNLNAPKRNVLIFRAAEYSARGRAQTMHDVPTSTLQGPADTHETTVLQWSRRTGFFAAGRQGPSQPDCREQPDHASQTARIFSTGRWTGLCNPLWIDCHTNVIPLPQQTDRIIGRYREWKSRPRGE